MQVTIDRDICQHHPTGCEQCVGDLIERGGKPDRPCITEVLDDGRPEFTFILKAGAQKGELVVTETNREEIIYHGFMMYVSLPPAARPAAGPATTEAGDTGDPPELCKAEAG